MVLDVLELAGKFLQLCAFRFVLNSNEGFEARFVIEPFVLVDLVGSDRRLDCAFQFHPGEVARVIIVAQEGVSPCGEEFLQGRLGRGRGGFAQEGGGAGQLAFVFDAVGNEREFPVGLPADYGEEAFRALLFGRGQRFDPRFDLGLGRVGRVKVGALWFGRRAENERLIVIEPRPGAFVDQKIVEPSPAFRARVAREIEEHRWVPRPRLAQEDAVDDLRSLDQSREHFAVVRRKFGDVGGDLGRRETGGHLFKLCLVGLPGVLRWSDSGGRREHGDREWKFLHRCGDFYPCKRLRAREKMLGSARDSRAGFGDSPKQALVSVRCEEKSSQWRGAIASTQVACAPRSLRGTSRNFGTRNSISRPTLASLSRAQSAGRVKS